MSYQVIARKWRPNTFEEVTGQEAITRTLRNAVEHERLHHAYLFSGARGVGKTTTARLLAKALNCHKTPKPNVRPCAPTDAEPMCASCQEIAESRSIDVMEFDAASNTQVEKIRDLVLESINISPARDRYRIFIIDEVHQLSGHSFNALLKTLEEPPPQVVFIMATTELHKVPDTILSRCQEFEFRTIATAKIFERLKLIADAEKIRVDDDALREIARAGEGSMRDAQSAFDQVISFSGERIEIEDVTVALGIAGAEMLTRAVGAIADNKPLAALEVVEELNRRGQDLRNFCRDLLSFMRDLLVAKIAGGADDLLDSAVMSREELLSQAREFSEADLIRFFNSLSDTETQLRAATQPRYILEIGLIKLIEMRRVAPLEKILERLANLEKAFADGDLPSSPNVKTEKPFAEPAAPEKKTLKIDFPLSEVPFPVEGAAFAESASAETTSESISETTAAPEIEVEKFPVTAQAKEAEDFSFEPNPFNDNLSAAEPPAFSAAIFLDSVTVKLLPITSEELEHIEDSWLDTAFEEKLLREGDDLNILNSASLMVEKLLGANGLAEKSFSPREFPASNGAAAFAPAKTFDAQAFVPPVFEETEISDEMPVLPDNPTEADLWRYAENHPKIKMALRIFRGKLIKVSRTEE